jgi:hypothetical protein
MEELVAEIARDALLGNCRYRRFHRLIHRQKRDDRMLRSFDRKEHNEFHTHESSRA